MSDLNKYFLNLSTLRNYIEKIFLSCVALIESEKFRSSTLEKGFTFKKFIKFFIVLWEQFNRFECFCILSNLIFYSADFKISQNSSNGVIDMKNQLERQVGVGKFKRNSK